jgi:hypothetical protein
MKMSRLSVRVIIASALLLGVQCRANDERTSASRWTSTPERGELDGGMSSSAGQSPLNPLPGIDVSTLDMPQSTCGQLLGSSTCDPVTSWPCDTAAGETCDYSNSAGAFRCYISPGAAPLCGFCDQESVFCAAGSTCFLAACEKYCCADSDCASGPCFHDFREPELALAGVCAEQHAACSQPDLDAGRLDGSAPSAAEGRDASSESVAVDGG